MTEYVKDDVWEDLFGEWWVVEENTDFLSGIYPNNQHHVHHLMLEIVYGPMKRVGYFESSSHPSIPVGRFVWEEQSDQI